MSLRATIRQKLDWHRAELTPNDERRRQRRAAYNARYGTCSAHGTHPVDLSCPPEEDEPAGADPEHTRLDRVLDGLVWAVDLSGWATVILGVLGAVLQLISLTPALWTAGICMALMAAHFVLSRTGRGAEKDEPEAPDAPCTGG